MKTLYPTLAQLTYRTNAKILDMRRIRTGLTHREEKELCRLNKINQKGVRG